MRIAILGGYGNAGRQIAEFLAPEASLEVVLLGRDEERARRAATGMAPAAGARLFGMAADARDPSSLRVALEGADLIVVASSTTESADVVADVALEIDADYFDIQLSSPVKTLQLRERESRIKEAGRCFVMDGGIHPGLPAALVRFAWDELQGIREAHVGIAFATDWDRLYFSPETIREFVTEFRNFDPSVYLNGAWRRGMKHGRTFDFAGPLGSKRCVPMCMEEIRELPTTLPGLQTVGCYIAGFGMMLDMVHMPLTLALIKLLPGRPEVAGRFFYSGLKRFASGIDAAAVELEALASDEERGTIRVRLSDADGYRFTAAAAVACIRQMLEPGRAPGLWTQGMFVQPSRFVADLKGMGVDVRIERTS